MATTNALLNCLSDVSRAAMLAHAHTIDLPLRTSLYQAEAEPRYGYFLTSGIASVVASGVEGGAVEVEVIGCEGVVGAVHLLGPALVSTQCFMQLPGTAMRIRLADLRRLFLESPEIRARILELVQVRSFTLAQVAGCHRLHSAEQRLARWLLMVRDRVHTPAIELTQEFLAEMLGTQRTTVSAVAAAFQRDGLIQYTRGHLRIVDQPGLEAASCGCYVIARDLLASLYLQPWDKLYSGSFHLHEANGHDFAEQ